MRSSRTLCRTMHKFKMHNVELAKRLRLIENIYDFYLSFHGSILHRTYISKETRISQQQKY